MKEMTPIQKDELIVFSSGRYSDYSYLLVCKAMREITEQDIVSLLPDCRPEWVDDNENESLCVDEHKLLLELIRKRWVAEYPCREIHFGDYGEWQLTDLGSASEDFSEEE